MECPAEIAKALKKIGWTEFGDFWRHPRLFERHSWVDATVLSINLSTLEDRDDGR